jgi:L-methionine (R)-S-oxide reductase
MLNGSAVISRLDARSREGADHDTLLRAAVHEISAASDQFDWVGIYLLEHDVLSLHNFVGAPTEHTRIAIGHGVCGTAVAEDRDINVPDVRALDNYISCSVGTRSEIVVLIRDPATNRIYGQLDLDSDLEAAFTESDEAELRRIADWLGKLLSSD